MKNETKNALLFAIILTFLTLVLVSFPLFQYLSVSLRLHQLTQENQLKAYAKEIEQSIQGILPVQKTFLFPRSILYKVALVDEKEQVVFSLIEEPIPLMNSSFVPHNGALFYQHPLAPNLLHVKSLIIQKEISHARLFFGKFMDGRGNFNRHVFIHDLAFKTAFKTLCRNLNTHATLFYRCDA